MGHEQWKRNGKLTATGGVNLAVASRHEGNKREISIQADLQLESKALDTIISIPSMDNTVRL
jgi:hypothetical protein